MNKRKFLAMLLSAIMVAVLAVPTLTAFAETQTPSNPKTITVEIFNGNADNVTLEVSKNESGAAQGTITAIKDGDDTVISMQPTEWAGFNIALKTPVDMSEKTGAQICFEIKATGNTTWADVRGLAYISWWNQPTKLAGGNLNCIGNYVVKKYDISPMKSEHLKNFSGLSIASSNPFNVKRVWIEYPNPDYVEDTTVDITFYDGNKNKIENLSTAYSTVDGVLPDYKADGKVFIGWQSADGKLYAAGAAVTAETPAELYAAAIEFATQDGAYIRVGENAGVSGIRFDTTFNAAEYTAIKNFVTEYGTLILPKDFLTEGKDFTLENFEVDKTILKIKSTVSTTGEDGVTTYRGAIFEINEANYNRYFAARGYFTVKYTNGETKNFYSAAYANNSVANVAKVFKESADYENLSDEQKSIVDAYAAKHQA